MGIVLPLLRQHQQLLQVSLYPLYNIYKICLKLCQHKSNKSATFLSHFKDTCQRWEKKDEPACLSQKMKHKSMRFPLLYFPPREGCLSLTLNFLFQLYFVPGTGRSSGYYHHSAPGLHCLHRGVLALWQLPLQPVGVHEGCVHRRIGLHADSSVGGSILCHCGSAEKVSCSWWVKYQS